MSEDAPVQPVSWDNKAPDSKEDAARRFPYIRPRNAATLIIIDRSKAEPKVLMGRRHAGHKFMPGKFVFPGGRIEPNDRHMSAASDLDPVVAGKLISQTLKPSASRGRALALAAIRETFEETGLLLGQKLDGNAPRRVPTGPWSDFVAQGVIPALDSMRLVARAITPPQRPKRFDTRFFAVDANLIAGEVGGIISPDAELVELVWVELEEARKLDLPAITQIVLKELDSRTEAGFGADLPVPFFYERHGQRRREEL